MPTKPTTWRRRPRQKPVAEYVRWSDLGRSMAARLLCTGLADWHEEGAARVPAISLKRTRSNPDATRVFRPCKKCGAKRLDLVEAPVDIMLLDQTYGGDKLDARKLRNLRVSIPLQWPVAVVSLEAMDALSPYMDDGFLIGDVHLLTGEKLGGFRSMLDRKHIPHRRKYTKEWFKLFGSAKFGRCGHCDRFRCHLTMGGSYFLESEIPSTGVRFDGLGLTVERSVAEKLDLFNKRLWPGGQWYTVPVFDERLDPIPEPWPRTWSELVQGVARNGDFPFDELGEWTERLRRDVQSLDPA